MVVFFEYISPWIMPLNDGRKWFEKSGKYHVNIAFRPDRRHESFTVTQLPAQPAWQGQNLKKLAHTSSTILLNADYEEELNEPFKLDSVKLTLDNSKERERLRRGIGNEWRTK
ncbi:hypothetical protein NW752_011656 [Fusarium irregulare]|nr:hypothetical protein NW752_011656 [Fusarium irregulare]